MSNRCYLAYLSPPWWVTMGYAPRYDFQDQPPAAFQPPVTPPQGPPDQPPPVTPPQGPPDQPPPVTGEVLVIAGTVSPNGAETTVDARRQADHTTVSTTTTDDGGNFALPVPINGTPFDGYLTLTKSGRVPTRVYVSSP